MESLEISEEDIRKIDDCDEAFGYQERFGVDFSGLNNLEGMIERLLLFYRKEIKGEKNPKRQIESDMIQLKTKDEQNRKKLKALLNETREIMVGEHPGNIDAEQPTGSRAIQELLKTEGAINDLAEDLNSKIDDIASGECLIVVSGETGAGKTTLLNLILEEDALPTHHVNCTSVVTKISYGPIRKAVVIYHDQKRPPETFERYEQVVDIVFVKDQDEREQQSEVKEIHLFIPSNILKSGIVFVDTPGIGENDAMDDVITQFAAANPIMGFIYVIKSNSAGGVQEDRILNLIRVILDSQKQFGNQNLPFDPKSAIFLCNLWDLITTDRDMVYENAVQKLKECWPNLESSQVIKISTNDAKNEVKIDPDYIKSDYKQCLEGIKDIYQRALDRRVKSAYKWIETILLRSTHHLKSLVKSIDSSERDMKDKMMTVNDKLHHLRKKSDGVLEDMNTRVKEASSDICEQFKEYLQSPVSRIAITNLIGDELPSAENHDKWEDVKQEIDVAISKRIEAEIIKWEEKNHVVKRLEERTVLEIRTRLHLLQNELEDIEETIQDNQNLSASQKSPTVYRDRNRRRITLASFKPPTLHIGPSESTALPFKIMTRVKHPFKDFFKTVSKGFGDDNKLKAYKENPSKIATQRAKKKLQNLFQPKGSCILELFIESLLERPVQFIRSLEANIPALIKSNEDLINQMASCRVNAVESHLLYEHMMEGMENLRHHLMEYGHGHIFVDDFLGEEITLLENLKNSGKKLLVSDFIAESSSTGHNRNNTSFHGLWTVLQNGFVMKDGREKEISVKIYLQSAGLEHTFPEVAKLRCLQHPNIGEFLGIYHSDTPIPALVYQNHITSLRQFIRSGRSDVTEQLPRIMFDIANGVEYLHRNRMVHMELSVDTVTVTYEGLVSLTGGCLPRCAAFPIDKEHIEVGDFVYLAPEVLHSELYVACADIYALALLLFELFVDAPFKKERKWRLDSFIAKVNPAEMLNLDSYLHQIFGETGRMTYFITECLDLNPDNRPKTDVFLQNLKALKHEIEILSKTPLEGRSTRLHYDSKSYRS